MPALPRLNLPALPPIPALLPALIPALIPALALALTLTATTASAQQPPIAFGGVTADITAPVEIAADALSVDQDSGQAIFTGNVEIAQGAMRLSAARVVVDYAGDDRRRIRALLAEGDVVLVSGPDAANARHATYDVESGMVTLRGDVLVTQGRNVLSGDHMTVNLGTGTAQVEGRVRSVLQPAGQDQ